MNLFPISAAFAIILSITLTLINNEIRNIDDPKQRLMWWRIVRGILFILLGGFIAYILIISNINLDGIETKIK